MTQLPRTPKNDFSDEVSEKNVDCSSATMFSRGKFPRTGTDIERNLIFRHMRANEGLN